MPKKKKNGLSPGRTPAQAGECEEGRGHGGNGAALARLARTAPQEGRANSDSIVAPSSPSSFQNRDEIVRSMQEMFSHLDPVVIYIVLSEADFKVENAMDALLELSDAAEDKTLTGPPLSGFEMAAALLDPQPPQNQALSSEIMSEGSAAENIEFQQKLSPETTHLTEEFDSLIDQELETLTSHQSHADIQPSAILLSSLPLPSESMPLSSLPCPNTLPDQQAVLEFEQLDAKLGRDSKLGSSSGRSSDSWLGTGAHGGASPVNELSFGGVSCLQERNVSVDFSHLTEGSSSRPSAFKAYHRPDTFMNHADTTMQFKGLHTKFLNVQAPDFQARVGGPVFITPVVQAHNLWRAHPFNTMQWLAHRPVIQPPLKPSATVPKSWTLPPQSRLKLEGHVLVLLRGAPGSGKTTLASAVLEQNPGGVVLSTDEYFTQNGMYHYEPDLLGEAHAWNHQRAKEAFEKGCTPIIIDNTNMQCWEMKPYVALALKHRYRVLFREPDTWWKTKPRELEKRTKHGVSREKIRRMLEHQDRYVSVQNIMASQPKPTAVFGVDVSQTDPVQQQVPVDLSHPDIVGDFKVAKPGGHFSSSLPDVSSVGLNCTYNSEILGAAECEIGSHSSKESVSNKENIVKRTGTPESELLDGAELDWELDDCIPLFGDTNSNLNENFDVLEEKVVEQLVPFSESIGQRVRRERERSRFANVDKSSQPLNHELGDNSVKNDGQQAGSKEDDCVGSKPERLNFVGDWPSESLEPRGQRSRKSTTQTQEHPDEEPLSLVKDNSITHNRLKEHSDCDSHKTEFQKLLVLLQGDDSHLPLEVNKVSPSLARGEWNSGLETDSQTALPDCVLEWKSGRSPVPEKDNSQPQSPLKEHEANEYEFRRGTKWAEISTATIRETSVETVNLDTVDKPSLPDTALSSGVEADHNPEVSQEKRKGGNRRAGKSCRLALTFTNRSPSSAYQQSLSAVTSPQLPDLMPPPQLEAACRCASVQSDPLDFSLLWRINRQKCSEPDSSTRGVVVLEGNPLRFVPNTKEQSTSQQGVPYRVCHEKGSQVEESDLRQLPLKQHCLEILCCHFKHIPLETLEDLFEKCNQDMDWVTNLLLDSGEQLWSTCVNDDDNGEDAGGGLGPRVAEEEDLNQVPEEEICDSQMTWHVLDPKVDSVDRTEQATSEFPIVQTVEPATSEDCSSAVTTEAGKPEGGAQLDQNEVSQVLVDSDPKQPLAHRPEGLDQGGTVEVPSSITDPNQSAGPEESRTQQDPILSYSTDSDTESQQVPLHELISFSQREIFGQYFDGEGWIEKEVGQEKEEEIMEIKEDVDAVTQSLLAQLEALESKKEEERKETEKKRRGQGKSVPMDIKMLELKLPTELALQLTELFGPVGISPGEFSPEDCSVLMDLTFAKLLHQKWKETIQERHRQAALSYHLLQEGCDHWGASQPTVAGQRDTAANFLIGADGSSSLSSQSGVQEGFPFMDHWNAFRPPVSLRNIMIEEQVMQDSLKKSRSSRWDVDRKDGAAMLKEKQLFTLFPTIDIHFLRDIFRDHNYSLEQTEQFLHTLLDDEPVRNVVAPDVPPEHYETNRSPSKERKWKQNKVEPKVAQFQDTEDPEYEDFRTEALLQRRRQQECFDKAAEAYRQGRKDVASFYAQQGHLHGQKMREANHRAAVQIFERVNATLLPQNVLDLHGLHVDEALHHLQLVLADKTSEWQQGLCRPQLSVITGRGNHSQGGIARIRPAVLDYLKSQHYRYTEPTPGLVLVTLH